MSLLLRCGPVRCAAISCGDAVNEKSTSLRNHVFHAASGSTVLLGAAVDVDEAAGPMSFGKLSINALFSCTRERAATKMPPPSTSAPVGDDDAAVDGKRVRAREDGASSLRVVPGERATVDGDVTRDEEGAAERPTVVVQEVAVADHHGATGDCSTARTDCAVAGERSVHHR